MIKKILFLVLLLPLFVQAKDVLVLYPIEVSESESEYQSEFGTALQEGLQERYKVFFGPAVEEKLEKEYQKVDCDAERCAQNVAIAFNGELVGDASVKQLSGGYIIKLVITNVFTDEVVESRTHPCRGCDEFSVVDALKVLGRGTTVASASKAISTANASEEMSEEKATIVIIDSIPTGASITINGEKKGVTPYKSFDHQQGNTFRVHLEKFGYESYVADYLPLQRIFNPAPVELKEVKSSLDRRNDQELGEFQKAILHTNYGDIKIALHSDKAPKSVENFLRYAQEGFYNGTIFHRVINNFMIQGGGFDSAMNKKQTHEPIENESDNELKNIVGSVAMARAASLNSATSQFFINVVDNAYLDSKDNRANGYTVFGQVIEGMDVVRKISVVTTTEKGGRRDVPVSPVVIQGVSVE